MCYIIEAKTDIFTEIEKYFLWFANMINIHLYLKKHTNFQCYVFY